MAAAMGMPGIVTTPIPPDGPRSSLTAMVPMAWTTSGSKAAPHRGVPESDCVAPADRVQKLILLFQVSCWIVIDINNNLIAEP